VSGRWVGRGAGREFLCARDASPVNRRRRSPESIDGEASPVVCTPRLRTDRHAGRRRPASLALAVLVAAMASSPCAGAVLVKDNLYGVKALGPSEAWAVGNFGSIYHTAARD